MEILSNDRYKGSISDDSDQALKIDELCDRLVCVQRAQVYLHDHIEESEARINCRLRVLSDVLKTLLKQESWRKMLQQEDSSICDPSEIQELWKSKKDIDTDPQTYGSDLIHGTSVSTVGFLDD